MSVECRGEGVEGHTADRVPGTPVRAPGQGRSAPGHRALACGDLRRDEDPPAEHASGNGDLMSTRGLHCCSITKASQGGRGGAARGGRAVCLAGEEAGFPRVDRPAWGLWPAPSPSGSSETTGRSFSWWQVAGNTAGRGRRRRSQGKVGNHHGVHGAARGGPHHCLSPLALQGPRPSPSVRVRTNRPPRTAGALCSQVPRPQRCPEEPESELTSLPHTSTPRRAKSSCRREGRKQRGKRRPPGSQQRNRQTRAGLESAPFHPFNHVQCGLGQAT